MRIPLSIPFLLLLSSVSYAQKPDGNAVSFTMTYSVTPGMNTRTMSLDLIVPKSQAHRQKITNLTYDPKPIQTFEKDGNAYAQFALLGPKKAEVITITVDAEIYRHDLAAVTNKDRRRLDDERNLKKFRLPEKYLESDNKEIMKLAQTLKGRNDEDTVRKIMAHLMKNYKKGEFDSADRGAVWMLEKKKGDCTEFSDLFIALCRANGIPARFCEGYLIHEPQPGDTPKHDWAEAYIGDLGWVAFDALHVHLGGATVDRLKPIYLYLDNQRQNPTLGNFHFYTYKYTGDAVKLSDEFKVRQRKNLLTN